MTKPSGKLEFAYRTIAALEQKLEAAQARVAELEKRGSTPEITRKVHAVLIAAQKTIFENRFLNDEMYALFELAVRGQKELAGMLAAPVAQAGQVPEGWKLMPIEPTEDIIYAIHFAGYVGSIQELRDFYQAVLAAAPVAQAGQVPDGWRVMRCTSSVPREGDQWEIYDPQGSGGVVSVHDVKDWAVRRLLDALAAAPAQGDRDA